MAVASLRKLDKNKDGELTRDELFAGMGRPPGGDRRPGGPSAGRRSPEEFLASLDKDGDGKISKAEAPERMVDNWDRVDTNGDGFIDKEERAAMVEAALRRGPGRPPGGPDRPQRDRPSRDEGQGGADKPKRPDPARQNRLWVSVVDPGWIRARPIHGPRHLWSVSLH